MELRGGWSCHLPVRSLLHSMAPSTKDGDEKDAAGGIDECDRMHSSFNCEATRPSTAVYTRRPLSDRVGFTLDSCVGYLPCKTNRIHPLDLVLSQCCVLLIIVFFIILSLCRCPSSQRIIRATSSLLDDRMAVQRHKSA